MLTQGKFEYTSYCPVIVKKQIKVNGKMWKYDGEVDNQGFACGHGVASDPFVYGNYTYTGGFLNDQFEGFGRLFSYFFNAACKHRCSGRFIWQNRR